MLKYLARHQVIVQSRRDLEDFWWDHQEYFTHGKEERGGDFQTLGQMWAAYRQYKR